MTSISSSVLHLPGRVAGAPAADPGGADGFVSGAIIAAILLAGVAFLGYRWLRAHRPSPDSQTTDRRAAAVTIPESAQLVGPELDHWATALLIATDERLRAIRPSADGARTSDDASSGPRVVDAVATATDELDRSFSIRRQLPATPTDDDLTRQAALREIIDRLTRANATLDLTMIDGGLRRAAPLDRPSGATDGVSPPDQTAIEGRIVEELAEADRDLRDLRTALARLGQLDVGVAGRVREVERALDRAHDMARERPVDAVAALRAATDARRIAASTLLVAGDPDDVRDRLMAAADSSIRTASAEVERLDALIDAGGVAVGELPRAAVWEARRELARATETSSRDPALATEAAGRALDLAGDAFVLAEADIAASADGGPGWDRSTRTSDGRAVSDTIRALLAR